MDASHIVLPRQATHHNRKRASIIAFFVICIVLTIIAITLALTVFKPEQHQPSNPAGAPPIEGATRIKKPDHNNNTHPSNGSTTPPTDSGDAGSSGSSDKKPTGPGSHGSGYKVPSRPRTYFRLSNTSTLPENFTNSDANQFNVGVYFTEDNGVIYSSSERLEHSNNSNYASFVVYRTGSGDSPFESVRENVNVTQAQNTSTFSSHGTPYNLSPLELVVSDGLDQTVMGYFQKDGDKNVTNDKWFDGSTGSLESAKISAIGNAKLGEYCAFGGDGGDRYGKYTLNFRDVKYEKHTGRKNIDPSSAYHSVKLTPTGAHKHTGVHMEFNGDSLYYHIDTIGLVRFKQLSYRSWDQETIHAKPSGTTISRGNVKSFGFMAKNTVLVLFDGTAQLKVYKNSGDEYSELIDTVDLSKHWGDTFKQDDFHCLAVHGDFLAVYGTPLDPNKGMTLVYIFDEETGKFDQENPQKIASTGPGHGNRVLELGLYDGRNETNLYIPAGLSKMLTFTYPK